jgi:hypothetical protein
LNKQSSFVTQILLCVGIFTILCLRALTYQYTHIHQIGFADDAFYYFVVAQHIVRDGMSTFDGTTLTNGYHPLWMGLLALQFKTFGESLLLTRCVEYMLGLASLIFALLFVKLPTRTLNVLFTLGFFVALSKTSFNGMETALFACCFTLFTYVSERRAKETWPEGIIDGVLAAAVIASRIDAVVFVLPQILFAAKSWRRKAASLSVVLLGGAAYASINRHYFGVPVPISGEIKSLGGLQANWALFRFLRYSTKSTAEMDVWLSAIGILFIIALFLIRKPRPNVSRHVVAAFLVGYALFAVRIAFMSSWIIWPWYNYPLIIGYVACVPGVLVMMKNGLSHQQIPRRLVQAAVTVLLVATVCGALFKSFKDHQSWKPGALPAAGGDLPEAVVATLDGAPVAMGDRAGNFAYHYPGSVDQLEGLMNNDQYLGFLREKKDVKSLLCDRKVRFVVAYEPDLTNYKVHLVHTIRPELSQYAAPEIQVMREDQVLRVPDFSSSRPGDGMPYLYVWKLRCGASQSADTE